MSGNENVVEGEELRLKCRASGPNMPREMQWFINGKQVGREEVSISKYFWWKM